MSGTIFSAGNAADAASKGRGNLKPRLQVLVGDGGILKPGDVPGTIVTFPISANCIKSNFFSADRFKIVCSLYNDPEQSDDFWSNFDGINVIVNIMFIGLTDWKRVFRGVADRLDIDLHKGTVSLVGRNFAGLLIDNSFQTSDTEKPIADVVTEIAARHGLTIDFGDGAPGESYGVFVQDQKSHSVAGFQSNQISEWDLVTRYAQQLGKQVYEDNGVLYFVTPRQGGVWTCQAPAPTFTTPQGSHTAFGQGSVTKLGPSNSIGLKVTHDFQFSQFSVPQTIAIHHQHHIPATTIIKHPADSNLPADVPIKTHYMEIQNKSDEDALAAVQNYHNVMNYREWLIDWKLAGPDLLDAKVVDLIELFNAQNSTMNGPFAIASIEYDISGDNFTQTIKGVWGRTDD